MKTLQKSMLVVMMLHFLCANVFASDLQYWSTNSAEWQINEKWVASAEEEIKFTGKLRHLSYEHTEVGLTYSGMADWLDLKAVYRHIYEKKDGTWKYEIRPHVSGILKADLSGLDLSNRNRLEYRIIEGGKDKWRYRNKTKIKYPVEIFNFDIAPYVADEIFLDLSGSDSLNKNRIYAGIGFKLLDFISCDLYYLFQSSKSGEDWIGTNILGSKLKFSF